MKNLVFVEKQSVSEVFKSGGLDVFINKIREKVEKFIPDVTTAKGRAEVKSFAYEITKSKTYLDSVGKDYVTNLKKIPVIVDAERKRMREELDKLKDTARHPLTQWEAKEAERIAAEKLAEEIMIAHGQAIIENEIFKKNAAIAKKEAELAAKEAAIEAQREEERKKEEQRKYEERIAKEAIETAKKEAEVKAAMAKEEADRKLWEAKEAARKAEEERLEAIKRAEKEKQEAIEAEQRAKKEAAEAKQQALKEEREREERRKANEAHKSKIEEQAIKSLVNVTLVPAEKAKFIVCAISKGMVDHLKIEY